MLEIILVRHGETDSNKKGTYLGWTDIELNARGIQQAKNARDKLKAENIDLIISSPLARAKRTAETINENFGRDIIYAEPLKERNFGIWDDLTYEEITCRYPKEHDLWVKDWIHYCVEGGESSIQAYHRIVQFMDELISQYKDGRILIVTHLGSIRKILAHLLNMGIEGSWHFKIDNCTLTKVLITDKYPVLTLLNA